MGLTPDVLLVRCSCKGRIVVIVVGDRLISGCIFAANGATSFLGSAIIGVADVSFVKRDCAEVNMKIKSAKKEKSGAACQN